MVGSKKDQALEVLENAIREGLAWFKGHADQREKNAADPYLRDANNLLQRAKMIDPMEGPQLEDRDRERWVRLAQHEAAIAQCTNKKSRELLMDLQAAIYEVSQVVDFSPSKVNPIKSPSSEMPIGIAEVRRLLGQHTKSTWVFSSNRRKKGLCC